MQVDFRCIGCQSQQTTEGALNLQDIITCNSCGLIFATQYSSLDYQDAYAGTDHLYAKHLAVLDRFQTLPDIANLLLPFEQRILGLIKQNKAVKKVVDVGCGTGRFLRAAGEILPSAVGYEVAEVLVQRLLHHGRHVIKGGITEFIESHDQSCDALCLLEVMEHLESPGQIIRDVVMAKKPELLFVVVPDYHTRRTFDGRFARHDVPPNHLSWWKESSLHMLLELPGYKVHIEAIPESRRSLLGHLVRKIRGEKSESSFIDWINAFLKPPTFWLLGVAEKK